MIMPEYGFLEELSDRSTEELNARLLEIDEEIKRLERGIVKVPFLDPFDTRYRRHERKPKPISRAVMFCIMDVSGSMDAFKKEMSKRFFNLLYRFLVRKYPKVEVVFIIHQAKAREVTEEEFFASHPAGGTVVSTAHVVMLDIQNHRYPSSGWDIYVAEASDGDNDPNDNKVVQNLMTSEIMPVVRYFAYVEVKQGFANDFDIGGVVSQESSLWMTYRSIHDQFPDRLALAPIKAARDIYPVFRGLFEKPELKRWQKV
jgi:hypothetical protein